MIPSLSQDNILLLRKNISPDKLKKNDIIVFKSPLNKEFLLIKRIIAGPNDHIKIYSNNSIVLNESITKQKSNSDSSVWVQFEWHLHINEFIVLGDNLNESQDSRFFGPISFDSIIGKAVLKLKPLGKIR